MKVNISNIQRYSVHDGYGIRTTVFLMGCNMRCAWCQNPEMLVGSLRLLLMEDICVGCGACFRVCPSGAICLTDDGQVVTNRTICTGCLACVEKCFFKARVPSGRSISLEDVFANVMRDEVFFRESGGGLTLSGGEPLLQPEFCSKLLKCIQAEGIHTAIETAGHVPWSAFEKVLPHTDLFLYDLKHMDETSHVKWTNVSNVRIIDNLSKLASQDKEIIIRVPLIPNVNDGDAFERIVDHVVGIPSIQEVHILPYHSLGQNKYRQLGLEYVMRDTIEDNLKQIEYARNYALNNGLRVSVGGAGFRREDSSHL